MNNGHQISIVHNLIFYQIMRELNLYCHQTVNCNKMEERPDLIGRWPANPFAWDRLGFAASSADRNYSPSPSKNSCKSKQLFLFALPITQTTQTQDAISFLEREIGLRKYVSS